MGMYSLTLGQHRRATEPSRAECEQSGTKQKEQSRAEQSEASRVRGTSGTTAGTEFYPTTFKQRGKNNRDSRASEQRGQQKAASEQWGQQKATRPAGSARNPKQQPHDALMGSKEAAKKKCQNSTLKHSSRRARTAKTAEPANSGDSQTRQGQQGQQETKKKHPEQ